MIKVGITEIDIGYEDKEYAREHCLEVMQEAYENGVELLVFPEMTLTGFTMMPARMWEAYRDGEIPESVSFFMENSRKYDMAMAFGYIEAFMADGSGEFDESRRKVFENKLAIVSGDEVIMDYAKIHPFSFSGEDRVYRAGSRICQANVKDLRLGGYICYDLRFPEIYSIRPCPKGWSESGFCPAILKPASVMMEDAASDRLLNASAVMAME